MCGESFTVFKVYALFFHITDKHITNDILLKWSMLEECLPIFIPNLKEESIVFI